MADVVNVKVSQVGTKFDALLDDKSINGMQKSIISELKYGDKKRNELVNAINKPRTTIYDNIIPLISRGILGSYKKRNNKRGRPPVYFQLKL